MTLTARDAITEAIYVKVEADDPVVADTGRASLLRHRLLEPLELDPNKFVWIDLKMTLLTIGAADELAVRWLERVRTPRHPVVAVFASHSDEVRRAIDIVLRSADQAAYGVVSSPFSEPPEVLGDVTAAQYQTLVHLARLGHASGREFAAATGTQQTAALNRLDAVHERGLVRVESADGGRSYVYPLHHAPKPVRQRVGTLRVAV